MSTNDNSHSTQQLSRARNGPSRTTQYSSNSASSRQVPGGSIQANQPPSYEETQRVWHNENYQSSNMNATLSGAANVSDAEVKQPLVTDGFKGYTFTKPADSGKAKS
ncbi:hypothetical protein EAF04_003535 [Stromatinia cepivora]|nr:hypothetical protein EAF04_003535 [Stromatinia cepivora]